MQSKFAVIDLFSGCGGSALGFRSAGFTIQAAVEINKTASDTFRSNFPETTIINRDVREVNGKDLLKQSGLKPEDNDRLVILACPPCQGFSSARRNAQRQTDPRNILILEFVRLVKEIKPAAFVMENVPGLARGIGEKVFQEAINQLSRAGYSMTDPKVLEATDYGVPQKRKRLVIMGTRLKGLKLSLPTASNRNPKKTQLNLPKWRTVRDVISDLPTLSAGSKNMKDGIHTSANLSELNLKRLKNTPHNGGDRMSWPDELILECHRNNNGHKDVYGRMFWDSPSPTITGGCVMISKGRFGHPEQDRAISLREAARLQTFPDTFKFTGNFGEIAKQIGNAVPSLLAQAIASSLSNSLNGYFVSLKKQTNSKSLKVSFFSNFVNP